MFGLNALRSDTVFPQCPELWVSQSTNRHLGIGTEKIILQTSSRSENEGNTNKNDLRKVVDSPEYAGYRDIGRPLETCVKFYLTQMFLG